MNLRLITEKEIIEKGLLSLLVYKPFSTITNFASKIGGGKTWATGTCKAKIPPYPRCEGAYEQVVINKYGRLEVVNLGEHNIGIRPVVEYSQIEKDCVVVGEDHCGLIYIEYGEYPQTKVEENLELEKALNDGTLKETTKEYSIPNPIERFPGIKSLLTENVNPPIRRLSPYFNSNHTLFGNLILDKDEPYKKVKEYMLEDGTKYVKVDNDWFKVEPIKWRVDKENNIAITESVIAGGVPLSKINDFLKEYLEKDIKPVKQEEKEPTSKIDNLNLDIDHITIAIEIGYNLKEESGLKDKNDDKTKVLKK